MTNPLAILSMYDWPETRPDLETFWQLIVQELKAVNIDAPAALNPSDSPWEVWQSPNLLIGQTCGWPYIKNLVNRVKPFARFDYGLAGCPRGYYRSVYIGNTPYTARFLKDAAALRKCPKVAVNGEDSQSGYRVFAELPGSNTTPDINPDALLITGSHRDSVIAVANAKADIAAIDAVSFELARKYEPDAVAKTQILGYSKPMPGLPLITAPIYADRTDEIRIAIQSALEKLDDAARETLLIRQVLPAAHEDYLQFLGTMEIS